MTAMADAGGAAVYLVVPDPLVWLPLVVQAGAGTATLTTERCLLGGWALANPGGAAGDIARIWSQGGATGQPLASVALGVDGQDTGGCPHPGLYCPAGIAVEKSAAAIEGVIWYAPLD